MRRSADTVSVHLSPYGGFARYVLSLGVEQSQQPEPLSAVSVLTFHDAVELFLQLTSEHLNVGQKRIDFMQYWDVIDPALEPIRLTQREAMRRLNNARIALKHHGTLPAKMATEQFRWRTVAFFEENTPVVFGIDFDAISIADLIAYETTRVAVREAEDQMVSGDPKGAKTALAIAFASLIDDAEAAYHNTYGRSPFTFGPSFSFETSFYRRSTAAFPDPLRYTYDDQILSAVESMQAAVKIMALGIDYHRYVRFKLLSPVAHRTMGTGGTYQVVVAQGLKGSIQWPPTLDACRYCLSFVVSSALHVQASTDTSRNWPRNANDRTA